MIIRTGEQDLYRGVGSIGRGRIRDVGVIWEMGRLVH